MHSSQKTDSTSETLSLHDAADRARRDGSLLRLTRAFGDRMAEICFYGDVVIHAAFGASLGVEAVREMLDGATEAYAVEVGRWPRQQTLLVRWDALLEEARRKANQSESAKPEPDEATVRFDSPRVPGLRR